MVSEDYSKMSIGTIENKLIDYFYRKEQKRVLQKNSEKKQDILPKHILKRRIRIIYNGKVVFDNVDENGRKKIPLSVQYSIKQYGYPEGIDPNKKTPLIYNITSQPSSICGR